MRLEDRQYKLLLDQDANGVLHATVFAQGWKSRTQARRVALTPLSGVRVTEAPGGCPPVLWAMLCAVMGMIPSDIRARLIDCSIDDLVEDGWVVTPPPPSR